MQPALNQQGNSVLVIFFVGVLILAGFVAGFIIKNKADLSRTTEQISDQELITNGFELSAIHSNPATAEAKIAFELPATPSTSSPSLPAPSPKPSAPVTAQKTIITGTFIDILSPVSTEKICLNKSYDITWNASENVDSITILLTEGEGYGAPIYTLGVVPGNYEGIQDKYSGKFKWTVGKNRENKEIPEGPGYLLILRGASSTSFSPNGRMTKPFTIADC